MIVSVSGVVKLCQIRTVNRSSHSCSILHSQLDDAARSVFKENVRLNEALSYHMKEAEELKKMTVKLAEENNDLIQKQVHLLMKITE